VRRFRFHWSHWSWVPPAAHEAHPPTCNVVEPDVQGGLRAPSAQARISPSVPQYW
jgi:hypothetical protein